MAIISHQSNLRLIHPLHAILLAGSLPLFLGALLSDFAYTRTFEIQWLNFASWLIVGALVFAGFALLWALIEALRADASPGRQKWTYVCLLAGAFLLGFTNALVHAKDGWATMPEGLVLSLLALLLVLTAVWSAFFGLRTREPL